MKNAKKARKPSTQEHEIYVVHYTGCVANPRGEGTNQSTIINKDYNLQSPLDVSLSLSGFLSLNKFRLLNPKTDKNAL
jgi:hypothetical protein